MDKRVYKTLEFDRILELLSEHALMESTKKMIAMGQVSESVKKVNRLQDETADSIALLTKKGSAPIMCTEDVRPHIKRAMRGGVLSIEEILAVGKLLESSRRLKDYPEGEEVPSLAEHFDALWQDKELEKRIFVSIADNTTLSDAASPLLGDIRRKIRAANNKIRDILKGIISSPAYASCLQEQIITMRDNRYVVPVKAEHKGDIKGIVHDTSSTGATLFIEPLSVVEANNEIRMLTDAERDEVARILAELSEEIARRGQLMDMCYEVVGELDYIFARGHFSLRYDCYRPILNDRGAIRLFKARHILIDPKKVVPIDLELGEEFDTLVITGPNTGGKTVALKTLGLIVLMAQLGLHIPAREGSVVGVFENVFADIGDEQSIEQSLSTFSSHMVNICHILENANHSSLCLFDELGAGTDPVEGASLAMSILEEVRLLGAKTMATTHYSELKSYALTTDRVENGACEFDVETLRPTYRLLIGIPGKSNAFAISRRLGIGEHIIDRARTFIAGEQLKFEDVISQLEKTRKEAIEDKERAERYKAEAEQLRKDTKDRQMSLESKTEKILTRAHAQAEEILLSARRSADEANTYLAKARLMKDSRKAQAEVEKIRKELSGKIDKSSKSAASVKKQTKSSNPPKELKPGDDVELTAMNQQGVVVSAPDGEGNLFVKVGIMKLRTHISEVRLIKPPKAQNKAPRSGNVPTKTMSLSPEIDVRGETVDSAEVLIDKFLDDAVLSSVGVVRIIHGKGTGLLRKGIHTFLRTRPYVKSFRLGVFGEGDAGVTVVELK